MAVIYNIEKWFTDPSMGHVGALCMFILIGALLIILTMMMELLWYIPNMRTASYYLTGIFTLFPSYALAGGLLEMGKFN